MPFDISCDLSDLSHHSNVGKTGKNITGLIQSFRFWTETTSETIGQTLSGHLVVRFS